MKEIDKLREWSHQYDNAWLQKDGSIILTTNTNNVYYGENYGEYIRSMINAIEQAIADRYMELPLDADGVPIHPCDTMDVNGKRLWVCGIGFENFSTNADLYTAAAFRHSRTTIIENVLREFEAEVESCNNTHETARRYAELIERMVRDD